MIGLNNQQKELLFDYCIGIASEEQIIEAKKLISSDKLAEAFCLKLKAGLSPLETLPCETCPDSLVESTIYRLKNKARTTQLNLQQLLASEQSRQVAVGGRFWRNLGQILATAAAILLIAGIFIPQLSFMRNNYWQKLCQMQLARIGESIQSYSNDNDGQPPQVQAAVGDPWWKVGYNGKENQSNTRNLWLLAKKGYLNPSDFVCPAKCEGKVLEFDPAKAKDYNDFPSRRYITYSFRITCKTRDPNIKMTKCRMVLMSDLNPLFENLPQDYTKDLRLHVNEKLAKLNSINHGRRGQNVLFGDNSVQFTASRTVGLDADDIFTLRDTKTYEGREIPKSHADAFLAP